MDNALKNIWAKTAKSDGTGWHPLILHVLDVAASADAILAREPDTTRKRTAEILGLEWEEARAWILLVVACHDLGKACPGFQCKWENMTGMDSGRSPNTEINHAFVSQIALSEILQETDWPEELAELVADAVGCHHGDRASPTTLDNLAGDRRAIGHDQWAQARRDVFEALVHTLKPAMIPAKKTLSGPDFMLLSGLTSFADWIGSNEDWFPFGSPDDCEDLPEWFRKRRANADKALDAIGWETRTPLSLEPKSFEQVFGFGPRPLQQAVANALIDLKEPAILLLEAPMGEGKTEAAFFAHLELQRRFGHRGLYVALPTKATGNAMFKRTLKFLRSQGTDRKLDLQLLHGAKLLNDTFQNLHFSGIHDRATGGEVRAGEWFTNKKRALLSEYGVGTVDQALLPILPVRHNFVRLWGLANRVVVFDEIHAYDAYTGTLLGHLLHWLLALGSSVVLLSATLSPSIRRKLAEVVDAELPVQEVEYPRLSVFRLGGVDQKHFEADPARRRTVRLQAIPADLPTMHSAMEEHLAGGGMGLALVNTVQRAQDLYRLFPEGEPLEREGQRVGKRLAFRTKRVLDVLTKSLIEKGRAKAEATEKVRLALAAIELPVKEDGKSEYLLFLGQREVSNIANIIDEKWSSITANETAPTEGKKPGKAKKQAAQSADPELKKALDKVFNGGKAVDVALFGRMLADMPEKNQNAACQVAHAISTHSVEREFDFYTAVDDLKPEDTAGADMMGTVEFNSACFYRYAVVDWQKLVENLQGDTELAGKGLRAFLEGFVVAEPTGKQNTFAAHNPPEFVSVSVRRNSAPRNLANAFEIALFARKGESLTRKSAEELARKAKSLQTAFAGEEKTFVLNLTEAKLDGYGNAAASLKELLDKSLTAVKE